MARASRRMGTALTSALKQVDRHPTDAVAVALARLYCRELDKDPELAAALGPRLLITLEALLMTPKSRAAVLKGKDSDDDAKGSPLDELRERRRRRAAKARADAT